MNKISVIFVFLILLVTSVAIYKEVDMHKMENFTPKIEYIPQCYISSAFVDGGILETQSLLDKKYIVNVFSTWCEHCAHTHKHLVEIKESNPDLDIYGFAWKEDGEKLEDWFEKHKNPYSFVALDNANKCFEDLKVKQVPYTLIVDKKGKVLYSIEGKVNKKILLKLINKIL